MREILFRGKRADNGEWIFGYYSACKSGHYVDCIKVIPETVGQYIGLTDTNGTKIFEGDIVRLYYDDTGSNLQVVFDLHECDFKATNGKENYGTNFQYLYDNNQTEVIGNIHDNPELLN